MNEEIVYQRFLQSKNIVRKKRRMKFIGRSTVMLVVLALVFGMVPISVSAEESAPIVNYRTHVQNVGWQDWKSDEEMSGTSGKGLRLEGIELILSGDLPPGAQIEYRTHIENKGWESAWSKDGETSGSQGQGLRLEGIQIRLVNMRGYSVKYRTHVQNIGWETTWASNGSTSGTQGKGLRLEGIEIKIVKNDQVEIPDLSGYQEKLVIIENTNQEDYTQNSWNNLLSVVENHIVTIDNTQEEIDTATAAIAAALAQLIPKNNETGNTAGNLMNGGRVAAKNDMTYLSLYYHYNLYSNVSDGAFLPFIEIEKYYSMSSLNIKDDWIYYSLRHMNITDKSLDGLYKMKTDGTNKVKLLTTNTYRMTLYNNQLFYTESDQLYSTDLDGNNKKVIALNCSYFTIDNGIIYYIAKDQSIHSIQLEGTNNQIILSGNEFASTYLLADGQWLYFTKLVENNKYLYRAKMNGTELTKLSDESIGTFNIADGFIYCASNRDAKIYKMKLDGTEFQKIVTLSEDDMGVDYGGLSNIVLQVTAINIIKDQIYYSVGDPFDGEYYFNITTSGENNKKID